MEIWRDKEYVIWCGICDWQVRAFGDDVTRYQENGCPACGCHDFGMRERTAKDEEEDSPSDEALNMMMALADMWPDSERPEPPYIGSKPRYAPR